VAARACHLVVGRPSASESAVGTDRSATIGSHESTTERSVSSLFEKKEPTGVWWRDHSLSLVIGAILLVQTAYAIWAGGWVFNREQPLGPGPRAWSDGSFWMWWSWEYNVSIVADTYGVLLIVLLSKWLKEVGSSESNGR
jgi:hypothetical protein